MINIDDFLNEYIQRRKDSGQNFDVINYVDAEGVDQSIDTETLTRDALGDFSTEMFHHIAKDVITVSASGTLAQSENQLVLADTALSPINITLPLAADTEGKMITVKKNSDNNTATVFAPGIDGDTNLFLGSRRASASFISDGTEYKVVQRKHETLILEFSGTATLEANYHQRSLILVDCSGGDIEIELNDPSNTYGERITIKRVDGTGNNLTVISGSGIDGDGSVLLPSQYQRLTVISDGATYHIVD